MFTEETLRLQFGTAATTIGTQWLALQEANGVSARPRVLAFEAKGRVQRPLRGTPKQQEDLSTWGGHVQVFNQSAPASYSYDGLWSWSGLEEHNLVEIDEFRPHSPLHNFYEGHAVSNGGNISTTTLEQAEDRVRTVLETCDQLRRVHCLVDMDSSWGGLAHEMMTHIVDECPSAVILLIGNDWSYPLSMDNNDAVDSDGRDRTKTEARRRMNVASAMALLSEVSHVQIPVAMSSSTLLDTTFPQLRCDRTSCADVSTIIATALELALSAYRDHPAYKRWEGFPSNMHVVELAAAFPYTMDPTMLWQPLGQRGNHTDKDIALPPNPFRNHSLLPTIQRATLDQSRFNRSFYRQLHFRGSFHGNFGNVSLQSSLDSFSVPSQDVAVRWSESPLKLPTCYRLSTLPTSSMDGISQLSASNDIGNYLITLGQQAATRNKRILHEFTRAGMSPDALEELKSTLATLGDPYVT